MKHFDAGRDELGRSPTPINLPTFVGIHLFPYNAQYRVRHNDNSIHWIEARGWVTYDDAG